MTQPTSSTTTCPNCGSAAAASQRFCGECGVLLRLKCAACGTENPLTFRFCSACGARLEAAGPPAGAPALEPTRDERRWATVLFADISGFTAMSQRMDPEDVKNFADRCAQRMSDRVRQFK